MKPAKKNITLPATGLAKAMNRALGLPDKSAINPAQPSIAQLRARSQSAGTKSGIRPNSKKIGGKP